MADAKTMPTTSPVDRDSDPGPSVPPGPVLSPSPIPGMLGGGTEGVSGLYHGWAVTNSVPLEGCDDNVGYGVPPGVGALVVGLGVAAGGSDVGTCGGVGAAVPTIGAVVVGSEGCIGVGAPVPIIGAVVVGSEG